MKIAAAVALCAAAFGAVAADDPQQTINALQAAMAQSQQQTAACNLGQMQMAAEIAALRKRVEELTPKPAAPAPTK